MLLRIIQEAAKGSDAYQDKFAAVMREFHAGKLHSGTGKKGKKGPIVTDEQQAKAIAHSEALNAM